MAELTVGEIDRLASWIAPALKRFGARGYGKHAVALTIEDLRAAVGGPDCVAAAMLERDGRRGLLVITRSTWEESILGRRMGKVFAFIADDYGTAAALTEWAVATARRKQVVFISATPGHSPTLVHVALGEAGFRVASQVLMVRADLEAIWSAVQRIPLSGSFRTATPEDADAVAEIARNGFGDARFTGDPFFPKAWGGTLFAAWARNLVGGAADAVIVAEARGRINGFVSVSARVNNRPTVPELMAVRPELQGWGLGAMLVRKMLEWYREAGLRELLGGTEKSNVAMNGLYHRLGFTIVDSNLVYHWTDRERVQSGSE